jgi:chromosome segregation ATPase
MVMLRRDIKEAREGGDEPKVIERFEQLCALVDEAKNVRAGLEPPKEEFDELVQACLQLANQLAKARPEMNVEETEKNVRTQQQEGDRAAQDMDQQAYGEAYQMLVQYARGLQAELRADSGAREEPPADPTARATGAVEHFRGACAQLRPFATGRADELEQKAQEIQARDPKGADDLRRQARTASEMEKRLADIDRDLAELQSQAQTDPDGVMRKCQVIQNDLQRTYDVLQRLGEKTGATIAHIRLD